MPRGEFIRAGSSPLTRGRLPAPHRGRHDRGLIPAHAGSTSRAWALSSMARAHPRSRGVDETPDVTAERMPGSSPLTRGRLREVTVGTEEVGLIPAHAGSTSWARSSQPGRPAHPRSRGVDHANSSLITCAGGSSPLTRGRHHRRRLLRHAGGLIPAHAGSTVESSKG